MSATGAPAMGRTDTAVRVISASPDRVFAALTDPDALAGPAWGAPNGTAVAASAQIHNASARLAARRAPGLDDEGVPCLPACRRLLSHGSRSDVGACRHCCVSC